jgi:hypothetical protein
MVDDTVYRVKFEIENVIEDEIGEMLEAPWSIQSGGIEQKNRQGQSVREQNQLGFLFSCWIH